MDILLAGGEWDVDVRNELEEREGESKKGEVFGSNVVDEQRSYGIICGQVDAPSVCSRCMKH